MSVEEIGQRLKLARDNSGLSLAQINERTKIPFNHLEAIEQGHFDDLPEPVYVAGFIKRYADCVGLDGHQAADEYRQELNQLNAKPEKSGFLFKSPKKQNNQNIRPQTNYYNRQPIEQAAPNLMKMVPFYALWVVIILALIAYLFNRQESIDVAQQDPGILALKQTTPKLNNSNPPIPAPSSTSTQDAPIAADEAKDDVAANISASEPDTSNSGTNNNQVTLVAKKHVWVEVKATSSGEALYTGFMEAGVSRNFTDPEGLRIRAGNGGNVLVTSAGKTEELGANGKISEKTFGLRSPETASVSVTQSESSPASTTKKSEEKQSSPKKSSVTASTAHKSISAGQSPIGKTAQSEGLNSGNKALDLPYRYSE